MMVSQRPHEPPSHDGADVEGDAAPLAGRVENGRTRSTIKERCPKPERGHRGRIVA